MCSLLAYTRPIFVYNLTSIIGFSFTGTIGCSLKSYWCQFMYMYMLHSTIPYLDGHSSLQGTFVVANPGMCLNRSCKCYSGVFSSVFFVQCECSCCLIVHQFACAVCFSLVNDPVSFVRSYSSCMYSISHYTRSSYSGVEGLESRGECMICAPPSYGDFWVMGSYWSQAAWMGRVACTSLTIQWNCS